MNKYRVIVFVNGVHFTQAFRGCASVLPVRRRRVPIGNRWNKDPGDNMKKTVHIGGTVVTPDFMPLNEVLGKLLTGPDSNIYMLVVVADNIYSLVDMADGERWTRTMNECEIKQELEKFRWFEGDYTITQRA